MEKFELNSSFDSFIDQDEINSQIISHLNSVFGQDIKSLKKAKEFVEELTVTQKALEERLQFATSEAPDKICHAVTDAEDILKKSKAVESEVNDISKEVKEFQARVQPLVDILAPNVKTVQRYEIVQSYKKWVTSIAELCEQVKFHLNSGNEVEAMHCYERIKLSGEALMQSSCIHLKTYACEIMHYWHEILQKKLEGEVEGVLKGLKWPFISNYSIKQSELPAEAIQRLETLLHHLLQLDIPTSILDGTTKGENIPVTAGNETEKRMPSLVSEFSVALLPLQLLLKPLEVRFLYHFTGAKATNSRSNPEWYLTQVLKWITSHEAFLESHIQPILNKNKCQKYNAKVEFMRGLVRLVVMKLSGDLLDIQSDEDLFCLTVQETLNFERELRLGLGYPLSQPSVLSVLTQPRVFTSWISLERKFALELMDEFISSVNAWQSEDETGALVCGDQFILLLQGITDRYKSLPQPGHRLQFLDLQLELLDDFRVRILQLSKSELSDPLQSNYCSILNTVHHIITALSDWSDLPFFIEMQFFKERYTVLQYELKSASSHMEREMPELLFDKDISFQDTKKERLPNFDGSLEDSFVSAFGSQDTSLKQDALTHLNSQCGIQPLTGTQLLEVTGSVFEDISDLYTRIESDMMSVVTQHVLTEIRARSQPYRKDKWFVTPSDNAVSLSSIIEISPSLCPLLEALVQNLNLLKEKLSPQLFTTFWKVLASSLNKFIYEEVILQNNFSEYGGVQLNYDMKKALFPVFGEYHSKPDSYFPQIKDCLILLTLPRPTALLLRDALKFCSADYHEISSSTVSPVKALEEHGVFALDVPEAEIILNIRTNMAVL